TADSATATCLNTGHIKKLVLPTGGRIEYESGLRRFQTIRQRPDGIWSDIGPTVSISTAVKKRTVYTDATATTGAVWNHVAALTNLATVATSSGPTGIKRELTVRVTDPTMHTTVNYFDAYVGGDSCFPNASRAEYGLPFTRAQGTTSGAYFL